MRVLFCALSLFAAACGKPPVMRVNPELQPYVDTFLAHAIEQGHPVYVETLAADFAEIDDETLGTCGIEDGVPTIEINQEDWPNMNDTARETLMYHELGHCLLGRNHNDAKRGDTPVSIMASHAFAYKLYEAYKADYLYELFNGK